MKKNYTYSKSYISIRVYGLLSRRISSSYISTQSQPGLVPYDCSEKLAELLNAVGSVSQSALNSHHKTFGARRIKLCGRSSRLQCTYYTHINSWFN
jgi:hypothetical protein